MVIDFILCFLILAFIYKNKHKNKYFNHLTEILKKSIGRLINWVHYINLLNMIALNCKYTRLLQKHITKIKNEDVKTKRFLSVIII